MNLVRIARDLARRADDLRFGPPVACVYNPLIYARRSHEAYLTRHARRGVPALLLGMNPGPFGMVQTGVPFGEVAAVRDWLGIEEGVERPPDEHPRRPVQGFACERSEVSGRRLWGWARERFGTPERFFARFFVWNYCPLAFLEASGRNLTPDKLALEQREPLFAVCNAALNGLVRSLDPGLIIGIGRFAEARARSALDGDPRVAGAILHPSPASPAANRGWARQVEQQLAALGAPLA